MQFGLAATGRFLWVWLTFLLAIWLAWHLLAQVNFGYPIWYDHFGIGTHIDHYAPQNRFRQDFELTDRETRLVLFAGIVDAIQHHGIGLEQLSYQNAYGTIPLLHRDEIVHLQDVARLIYLLNQFAIALSIIWILLTTLTLVKKMAFASLKQSSYILGSGIGLALLILLLLGPTEVFYQFHIWIFPADHPWFFYYQDSLMSTMMKAPDLFAMIATALLAVSLVIFYSFQHLFYKGTCKNTSFCG